MLKLNKTALAVLMLCLAGASAAPAQSSDYGVPSDDWNYSDPDIRQTVARVGYVSGDVSFARGDDPDDWQPADSNIPMTLGDRVWTSGGRLELQVHGGSYIRLAGSTDLTALNLTEDTKQFSISAGVASFRVPRLADDEVYEVDTPNAAVTFERTGDYRIDVRPNGDTRVQVRQGRAMVASAGGQVPLGSGGAMIIEGSEPPRYDMVAMPHPDGWDGWVSERDARYANVRSYQYVSPDIAGVQDLDQYGRWQQVPNYGWCWSPTQVAVGWQPYRVGRWIWQDPWGWTWVSTEPWGWAPYHYGRWVTVSSNWFWVPVAPRVPVVAYSPALVAFVGGGPGFSVSVGVGTNYVGWFPLAPRDPLIPWWGRPSTTVVNVTNITYVNQTYVTVVNQNTFVQSRIVNTNYVKDRSVIQSVERAPVVRGAIPIAPTRDSIRAATRQGAAARPSNAVASRAVVTRMAPPPAPPRFDNKLAVISENRGRPVTTVQAQQISTREGRSAAPARAVRPAASESGRVTLAPKNDNAQSPRPEPVVASRGRQLATKEQPSAPSRENSAQRGRTAPEQPQSAEPQANPPQSGDAAARDRARQEQSNREQVDRMNAQREQAQREQAQKDQADRQQAQRDQAQKDQADRQRAQRDQAQREQAQKDQAEKQQAQREQAQREQAQKDQAQRNAQREQVQRQQQQQQQEAQKDQPHRAPRPTARPAEDGQPERGTARPPVDRSQQPPPPQAQSQQDKEKNQPSETKVPPQRGRKPTPKPTPKGDGN